MYALFAWRYFKSGKSAGAIQIISRLSLAIIAFATCCQLLVLSVYNGFEEIVQSLYASFYTDFKVVPANGKFFQANDPLLKKIKAISNVESVSCFIEEKALLKHGETQTVVRIRGVDENYDAVSGVPEAIRKGSFSLGDADNPGLVMGAGVQYAADVYVGDALPSEPLVVILPNTAMPSGDLMNALTEGVVKTTGSFSIQQDFDNYYAFTNLPFLRQQMQLSDKMVSGIEIKTNKNTSVEKVRIELKKTLGDKYVVQTREEQNMSLYKTMKTEKWVIFAVLTFILIIAAFNIISAMTMLVIEKQKDIHVLRSLGSSSGMIRTIFLSEGVLLGLLGTLTGVLLAISLCLLQQKWKWLKIRGGSFLIDYFPVKLSVSDISIVALSALCIVILSAWIPAHKASQNNSDLK